MRKKIVTLLIVLTMAVIGFGNVHAETITLNVLDPFIEEGETFDIEVLLDGENPWSAVWDVHDILLGFGFDVAVTGTNFSYINYTLGSLMNNLVDSGPNNVTAGAATDIDDLILATLHFSADMAGTSGELSITGIYDGLWYGLWYANLDNAASIQASTTITINEATVPEPSTFLLFSLGLLGFARFGRRK